MHQSSLTDSFPDSDILAEYRRRIWMLFAAVFTFVFLPGAVYIFWTGYQVLAVLVTVLLGVFVLNGYALSARRYTGPAMAVFVVALMAVIGLCLVQRGVTGVFWTFPGVLLINFLSFGRAAKVYTVIYFVYVSAIMVYMLELSVSTRAVIGLGVTIVITNIFLEIIDKLQKRLAEQSAIDPLTSALNRREMDTILQDAIERKRRTNVPASLLVLDIDEFKSVNDTFGHAVGDHVLKELAALIMRRRRQMDKLFRLGGEEFMVFLPDTPGEGAVVLAEELRRLVADTKLIDGRTITISIGITELEPGETIDPWIKRGDDALYIAKQAGRNQTVEGKYVIPAEPVETGLVC